MKRKFQAARKRLTPAGTILYPKYSMSMMVGGQSRIVAARLCDACTHHRLVGRGTSLCDWYGAIPEEILCCRCYRCEHFILEMESPWYPLLKDKLP